MFMARLAASRIAGLLRFILPSQSGFVRRGSGYVAGRGLRSWMRSRNL